MLTANAIQRIGHRRADMRFSRTGPNRGERFESAYRPGPTHELLDERQLVDDESHRAQLLEWALSLGKNSVKVEGYSHYMVENHAYRLDKLYRWVWDRCYTTVMTHEDADAYLRPRYTGRFEGPQDEHTEDVKDAVQVARIRARRGLVGTRTHILKRVRHDEST